MNDIEQYNKNWTLLWDIRRCIRYAEKRAGWFDSVSHTSQFLAAIFSTGTFAAFAKDKPTIGFICSGITFFLATFCAYFDYPKKASLFRTLRKEYLLLLSECEKSGGRKMTCDDYKRLAEDYHKIEAEREETVPTSLVLLMNYCENEVAERDMEEKAIPPSLIPWWAIFIRQLWFWRWPAKNNPAATSLTAEETEA